MAVVLQCSFDLNTVCIKSTLVSLDGWCCAKLAQLVIFVVTLRTWFVILTVSSSKAKGRSRIAPDCTSV